MSKARLTLFARLIAAIYVALGRVACWRQIAMRGKGCADSRR